MTAFRPSSFATRPGRWLRATLASVTLVGALVGCGGSVSTAEPFQAGRLIVFGDELSLMVDSDGKGNARHYGINALDSTDSSGSTVACGTANQRVWVQYLASLYGLTFAECNPNGIDDSAILALSRASYGATAADLKAQVLGFEEDLQGGFNETDLVSVLVGLHDVLQVYHDTTYATMDDKQAEIYARGKVVAQMIKRITGNGTRVLVSLVMDVGLTPYAQALGATEAGHLTALSDQFNLGLRQNMSNNGTHIGLVELNSVVRTYHSNGTLNHTELACDEDHRNTDSYAGGTRTTTGNLLNCTTATLVSGDTNPATTYLWADALHPNAYLIQRYLGQLAQTRASDNF